MRVAATIVLGSAVLLAASGTVRALDQRPVRSLLEARQHNVVIQEWDSSCGAAALATILRFQLGDPVTERAVALGMIRGNDPDRIRGRGGFSLLDMKRLAEARGFSADGYAGLSRGQLLKAAPAIVPIRSHAGDHFVVFRGVLRGQAILADPAFGNRSLPFAEFESLWKDRLAFVVRAKVGPGANRLLASHRDLLRVGDDAERAATEEKLPKPLAERQLAQAFAIDRAPLAPPQVIAEGPATSLPPVRRDGAPPIPAGTPPQAAGPSSPPVAAPIPISAPAPVAGPTISTSPSGAPSTLISAGGSTVGGVTGTVSGPVTGIVGSALPSPTVTVPSTSITLPGTSITLPATSISLPPIGR